MSFPERFRTCSAYFGSRPCPATPPTPPQSLPTCWKNAGGKEKRSTALRSPPLSSPTLESVAHSTCARISRSQLTASLWRKCRWRIWKNQGFCSSGESWSFCKWKDSKGNFSCRSRAKGYHRQELRQVENRDRAAPQYLPKYLGPKKKYLQGERWVCVRRRCRLPTAFGTNWTVSSPSGLFLSDQPSPLSKSDTLVLMDWLTEVKTRIFRLTISGWPLGISTAWRFLWWSYDDPMMILWWSYGDQIRRISTESRSLEVTSPQAEILRRGS